jgi:hypothetical protein
LFGYDAVGLGVHATLGDHLRLEHRLPDRDRESVIYPPRDAAGHGVRATLGDHLRLEHWLPDRDRESVIYPPTILLARVSLQGHLAHKKTHPPRTQP